MSMDGNQATSPDCGLKRGIMGEREAPAVCGEEASGFSPLLPSQRPGEGYKSAVKSEVPPADWCIIECLFRTFLKALALIILILQCNSGFWPNQKNLCPVRFAHQSQCG